MPERGRTCGHPLGPARRWRDLHRRVPRLHRERDRALGSGAAPEPGHRRSPSGCPRLVGCLASPGGNVTGLGAVSGPRRGRMAATAARRGAALAESRGRARARSGPSTRPVGATAATHTAWKIPDRCDPDRVESHSTRPSQLPHIHFRLRDVQAPVQQTHKSLHQAQYCTTFLFSPLQLSLSLVCFFPFLLFHLPRRIVVPQTPPTSLSPAGWSYRY